ncbi:hypothetical protein DIPPA_11277, partial [Diplonema papillatum]
MSHRGDWRRILVEFYQMYNPIKIRDIDTILDEFEGSEAELLQSLLHKYNVPPGAFLDEAHRLLAMRQQPSPAAFPESVGTDFLAGGAGSMPQTPDIFDPHVTPTMTPGLQKRIQRLQHHAPQIDEGTLVMQAVVQQRIWRNAIIQFYQRHQPAKLANIHEIFQECDGDEEMLYELLESKYKQARAAQDARPGTVIKTPVAQPPATASSLRPKPSPAQRVDKGVQCDPKRRGIVVSNAPLTHSMDVSSGEILGLPDIPDQLEWSLLVVLEQEERVRSIMSGLLGISVLPDTTNPLTIPMTDAVSRVLESLDRIHKDAMSLRVVFDQLFDDVPASQSPPADRGSAEEFLAGLDAVKLPAPPVFSHPPEPPPAAVAQSDELLGKVKQLQEMLAARGDAGGGGGGVWEERGEGGNRDARLPWRPVGSPGDRPALPFSCRSTPASGPGGGTPAVLPREAAALSATMPQFDAPSMDPPHHPGTRSPPALPRYHHTHPFRTSTTPPTSPPPPVRDDGSVS